MKTGSKILTGVAVTVIVALTGHMGTGDGFISGLEEKAQTELDAQGLEAARITLGRDPLSRHAMLEGELADESRQKALDVVAAIPGISSASWKGADDNAEAAGGTASDLPAAIQEKIARCQAEIDKIARSDKISFRSGSAYVSPASNRILDSIAGALKSCDDLSIAVEGHTDDNGDSEVNRRMSQERADRIKAGLVKRGISDDRITATGYGSTRPLAKGTDAAADAENRRIEIRIGAMSGSPKNDAEAQQGN